MSAEITNKEDAQSQSLSEQLASSVAKIQVEDAEVDSGDEENDVEDSGAATIAKKKKKNKKKKKKAPKVQTDPPSVPLSKLFAGERYPEGELFPHGQDDNTQRVTDEEIRAKERECDEWVNNLRKGGEIHRQVRDYARRNIQPGMSMIDITESIEKQVRDLTAGSTWKEAGNGFPTGVSVNDCAAHYTPNKGDKKVLHQDDVLKVDFGVQVGGRIVDSAFTMTWNDRYDPLISAVRAATNAGIAAAGIDARLGEIGGAVQEVMESYEIELNGKTYPIRAIKNLCGHNISPYQIHGGKSVPIIACEDDTKMEEGEVFAIETFGSTGRGYVIESGECSHYALLPSASPANLRLQSAKQLYSVIDQTFGTLPFCRRWLDLVGQDRYLLALNNLVKSNVVQDYPPLMDSVNSYTAQFEHTLVLRPTAKEIISRGDDY